MDSIHSQHNIQNIGYSPHILDPHGLDPLAAQHTEDDHKSVHEVDKVPARFLREMLDRVVGAEELFAHHGEDEDNDGEDKAQVAERSHRPANDTDKKIERRPRLG